MVEGNYSITNLDVSSTYFPGAGFICEQVNLFHDLLGSSEDIIPIRDTYLKSFDIYIKKIINKLFFR